MRISDWSSDVCSSDLRTDHQQRLVRIIAAELARDDDDHPREPEQRRRDRARADLLAEEDHGHIERHQRRDEGERDRLGDRQPRERPEEAERHPGDEERAPRVNPQRRPAGPFRSEEHTSELQSLMRTSYAVFCLKKKTQTTTSI